MNMRAKKRVQVARYVACVPWVPEGLAEVAHALHEVRQARLAMLRRPDALAGILAEIRKMQGPGRRVLRRMLDDDLKLMRQMDRKAVHKPRVIHRINFAK
jgi:hypothetical protein